MERASSDLLCFSLKTWDEIAENAAIAEYCPNALDVARFFGAWHPAPELLLKPTEFSPQAARAGLTRLLKRLRKAVRKKIDRVFDQKVARSKVLK